MMEVISTEHGFAGSIFNKDGLQDFYGESAYDIMTCSEFVVDNADEGKTADGKNIVFKMERQTAIAYFHISGGPADESVVSARLSVEGGTVAASSANISDFTFAPTGDLQEITIAFPESSPKASDFKLWFNILPTEYSKMTLTVETPKIRFEQHRKRCSYTQTVGRRYGGTWSERLSFCQSLLGTSCKQFSRLKAFRCPFNADSAYNGVYRPTRRRGLPRCQNRQFCGRGDYLDG